MRKSIFKAADCFLYSAVLLLIVASVFLFHSLFSVTGDFLCVNRGGEKAYYALSQNRTLQISCGGYEMEIVIEGGQAYVKSCTCPDRVCVRSGRIKNTNETVVCVPAGISLEIVGKTEGEVDDVAK